MRLDANARLCSIIQQYPIIFDRSHKDYNNRELYDLAWNEITIKCEEASVYDCKSRWREIRNSFAKSFKESSRKSKENRDDKDQYLEGILDYLKPHLPTSLEEIRFSTHGNKMDREKAEVKAEADSDVEIVENTEKATERKQESESLLVEKNNIKGECMKNDNKDIDESKLKDRRSTSRNQEEKKEKVKDKDGESVKSERITSHEAKATTKRRRSLSTRKKLEENTDTTDSTENEPKEESKSNKKAQIPKKKVDEFYISSKNEATGSILLKKNNNNTKDVAKKEESVVNEDGGEEGVEITKTLQENNKDDTSKAMEAEKEDAEENEDGTLNQVSERRWRFRRACKRSVDKTASDPLQLDEKSPEVKAPEVKRSRRSTDRRKSVAKSRQSLDKTIELAKKESKPIKPSEIETSSKTTQTVNDEIVEKSEIIVLQSAKTPSASKMLIARQLYANDSEKKVVSLEASPQRKSVKRILVDNSSRTISFEPKDPDPYVLSVNQAIQCDLQKGQNHNDFLDTLRPYFNEMNPRQKLHFKKKIFESLMEVFDNDIDFPACKRAKLTTPAATESDVAAALATAPAPSTLIPAPLSNAVSGEELSLVRELVALVQAAKQTPELPLGNINENYNDNDQQDDNTDNNNENNNTNSASSCSESSSNDNVVFVSEEKRSTHSPAVSAPTVNSLQPPPLLRATPTSQLLQHRTAVVKNGQVTYTTTYAPTCTNNTSTSTTTTAAAGATQSSILTTSRPSQADPQLPYRRVIRKLVKVNELGQSAYSITTSTSGTTVTTSDGQLRRLYRIMPNSAMKNVGKVGNTTITASSTTGNGTSVTPRTTSAGAVTVHKNTSGNKFVSYPATIAPVTSSQVNQNLRRLLQPISPKAIDTTSSANKNVLGSVAAAPNRQSSTNTPANSPNLRQLVPPAGSLGWRPASSASVASGTSTTSTITSSSSLNTSVGATRNAPSVATGARPIMRRYSVCGALSNATMDNNSIAASNNILTTTANDKVMPSPPKITIIGPGSTTGYNKNDPFKLPALVRSVNSSLATATASTTTTAATMSSRVKPAVNISISNGTSSSPVLLPSSARTIPQSAAKAQVPKSISGISRQSPTQGSLLSPAADQRPHFEADTMNVGDFSSVDFSNIIDSNSFEVITIKNEPIDF